MALKVYIFIFISTHIPDSKIDREKSLNLKERVLGHWDIFEDPGDSLEQQRTLWSHTKKTQGTIFMPRILFRIQGLTRDFPFTESQVRLSDIY